MSSLSTLRSQARTLFAETDPQNSQVGDPELNSWANMWQRNLATLIEWPMAEATSSTVQSQETYGVPSDLLSLVKIFLTDENSKEYELDPATLGELRTLYGLRWKSDDAGQPKHYYFADSDVVGIHPKPNSTYASKTLRMMYVVVPATMSADGDTPDIPEVLHDTAQYFMASHALMKIGKSIEADKMLTKYFQMVKILRNNVTKKSQDLMGYRFDMESD